MLSPVRQSLPTAFLLQGKTERGISASAIAGRARQSQALLVPGVFCLCVTVFSSICAAFDGKAARDRAAARRMRGGGRLPLGLTLLALTAASAAFTEDARAGHADGEVSFCEYEVTVAPFEQCCGCLGPPVNVGQGINDLSHVVGWYRDCDDIDTFAFLWTGGPEIVTLDLPWEGRRSWAFDINNAGQIVGTIEITDDGLGRVGFFFDGERFFNFGTLPGGNYSEGAAVNEHGQITGTWGNSTTGDPVKEAFFWDAGVMTGLGAIFGTPSSAGEDINDHGCITGWMGESLASSHAFQWDGEQVVDLGLPAGAVRSAGTAINNDGDVAGFVHFIDSKTRKLFINAALWKGGVFIDLGRLPGHERCRAFGVNEGGEVIGFCGSPGVPSRPFLWRDGVMLDLNTLVRDVHETLKIAWAINESGVVTGNDYGSDAFLAMPVDAPFADLTGDCAVDADDLLALLKQWGGPGSADFDGNGIVGFADLLLLLQYWS